MIRAEAVERLTSLGHVAQARDWSMGATIQIYVAPVTNTPVQSYLASLCLYPHIDDGRWWMTDFHLVDTLAGTNNPTNTHPLGSLEAAVDHAHYYITFLTPILRKG